MKQIVIFGGCFNPPLNSHFLLAQQMINEYKEIEKIIFVPVNSKYEKRDLINNSHRYNMLKIVCDKNSKFEVSKVEINQQKQPYTIETLLEMQKRYKENEICFTMGSDNLKELRTWYKKEELVKKFKIYIFERDTDNIEEIIEQDKFLKENKQSFIKIENNIRSNLNSTFVRKKIKEQKSIKYLTPDEVISYIEENRLYKKLNKNKKGRL